MLRVGIVGMGHWGPNYVRILSGLLPGVALTACVDRVASRLERIHAQHPNVEILLDHRQLIEQRLVDAVVICSPATSHCAIAQDCLEAGLDVLVEKPMASSAVEAEAMM